MAFIDHYQAVADKGFPRLISADEALDGGDVNNAARSLPGQEREQPTELVVGDTALGHKSPHEALG